MPRRLQDGALYLQNFPVILLFPTLPQSIGLLVDFNKFVSFASTLGIQLRVLNHSPKIAARLYKTLPLVCLFVYSSSQYLDFPELRIAFNRSENQFVTASVFPQTALANCKLPTSKKMRAELLRLTECCTFTGSCPQAVPPTDR